jgi:hypothetical protein
LHERSKFPKVLSFKLIRWGIKKSYKEPEDYAIKLRRKGKIS